MAKTTKKETEIRLTAAWRVDLPLADMAAAEAICVHRGAKYGEKPSRSSVMREALRRGLQLIARHEGISKAGRR